MLPMLFVILSAVVVLVFSIRACNDLNYCIKHTLINKASKDAELKKMREDTDWLMRNHK